MTALSWGAGLAAMGEDETLVSALAADRLSEPYSPSSVGRHLPNVDLAAGVVEMNRFHDASIPATQVAELLRAVATERRRREDTSNRVEFVWSGLVSSPAVPPGKEVFAPLARRMEKVAAPAPSLS